MVAHEVAVELQRRGCFIASLILLDAQPGIDDGNALPEHALHERQVVQEGLRLPHIDIPERNVPLTYEQLEEVRHTRGR